MVNVKEIEKLYRTYFDYPGFITPKNSLRINPSTGKITVLGNVFLWHSPPEGRLPVEFEMVNFTFQCQNRNLISLQGCPEIVRQDFWCNNNKLESLVGGPKTVGGNYRAGANNLKSLEGLAAEIGGALYIDYTRDLPLLRALVAKKIIFTAWDPRFPPPKDILNKYAGQGKMALFDCQKELEDAGFEENARW